MHTVASRGLDTVARGLDCLDTVARGLDCHTRGLDQAFHTAERATTPRKKKPKNCLNFRETCL